MSPHGALMMIAVVALFLTIAGSVMLLAARDFENMKLHVAGIVVLLFAALHALPPLFYIWTKAIGG